MYLMDCFFVMGCYIYYPYLIGKMLQDKLDFAHQISTLSIFISPWFNLKEKALQQDIDTKL
jgi:hypothetical protein